MNDPRLLTLIALTGLVAQAPAQEDRKPLREGLEAPPLECRSAAGVELTWDTWSGKAVMLFFHSETMAFSERGLHDLVGSLEAETGLRDKAGLLVVTNGKKELGSITELLDRTGLEAHVTVDPDRSVFRAYGVVAFPTVLCVDAARRIVLIARGFGPMLVTRAVLGIKLAAGLIDREAFERATTSPVKSPTSRDLLRLARTVRMVHQLIAAGMLEEARESLLKVVGEDTEHLESVALLAKVFLLLERRREGKPWVERARAIAPESREVRLLDARLAVLEGKAEAALERLEGLDDKATEVALLKGAALERLGRYQEAAAVYRSALQAVPERGS